MRIAALIPAYRPGQSLVDLANRLSESALDPILIVDDGSGAAYAPVFEQCRLAPRVRVLAHPANRGKGAALKTGMRHLLENSPNCAGVVTADADGQHHADDVLKIAERVAADPAALVLGVRDFGPAVPRRNRLGNLITRAVLHVLLGRNLRDTQTGLRGIPRALMSSLTEIASNGYEFELDMLIASKHRNRPIVEESIRTIYLADPSASHFSPLLDSLRISFVLLRFTLLSLATAALDNLVFWSLHMAGAGLLPSQAGARLAATLFNYPAARRSVFLSRESHRRLLPRYLLLVAASGTVAYHMIRVLHSSLGMRVMWAKLLAETALFIVNFLIQRDFVFTRPGSPEAADHAARD
jgi:dolichol-phosphate mannosyltransferase